MNFYPFHIGDYAGHTRNLSLLEDLAYRRLLDAYYLAERPLNGCVADVARSIGMREQIEEVTYVLGKFFYEEDGEFCNKRADTEIAKYHDKKEKASNAGKASAQQRLRIRSTSVEEKATDVDDSATDVQPTMNHEPVTNTAKAVVGAKRRKAQVSLPEDFEPNATGIANAQAKRLDIPAELEKFRNHHTAKGSVMADWQAAWRTWVGNVRPGMTAMQGAGVKRGSDEYAALHRNAAWWRDAGFGSVWEADAAKCWHDTAQNFHDGKRIEVAA